MTLRAWCTSASSTSRLSASDRIAELEAAVAEHAEERRRTAKRIALLEQECAAPTAKVARQATDEVQANARLEDDERSEVEREAQWRQERSALEAARQRADERCVQVEAALARLQGEHAALERREAALRAELDAARTRADDAPASTIADAELERLRTSLADAERVVQEMRRELAHASDQMTALSKTRDEIVADRSGLAAELAAAKTELASSADAARLERQTADKVRIEREAQSREERGALMVARLQAEERSAQLETALAHERERTADAERREATLRAELDAARSPIQNDSEAERAGTELGHVRASLAETETALRGAQGELARTLSQVASLSTAHDEAVADRCRLAADLAAAEERAEELQRRLDERDGIPPPSSRPIPF